MIWINKSLDLSNNKSLDSQDTNVLNCSVSKAIFDCIVDEALYQITMLKDYLLPEFKFVVQITAHLFLDEICLLSLLLLVELEGSCFAINLPYNGLYVAFAYR